MNGNGNTAKRIKRIRAAFFGTRSRAGAWFAEFGDYRVSPNYRGLRWLTAATLVLLLMEVVTGILLALYYYPEPEAAYATTRFLNERVPAGWLIRGVHAWAGELLLVTVVLHLAFVYFRRAYAHPRQYVWVVGALLLPAVLAFQFTGRLLPWDTDGYAVTRRGLDLIEQVPVLGKLNAVWLRGGQEMGPDTLSRFFATHTLVLPWLVVGLLALHLYLVRRYGLKEDES